MNRYYPNRHMQQSFPMVHTRMSWPMMNVMVWRVPTSGGIWKRKYDENSLSSDGFRFDCMRKSQPTHSRSQWVTCEIYIIFFLSLSSHSLLIIIFANGEYMWSSVQCYTYFWVNRENSEFNSIEIIRIIAEHVVTPYAIYQAA